jgi:hypothetical protein
MIKLKHLLRENKEEVIKNALRVYWNFVFNALSGRNPDSYYRQYQKEINIIADALKKRYGPSSGGTAWRGIILDPSEVHNGKVNHVDIITYVSFTEDKRIAIAFGDIENPMAEFMMARYPNKQGYLITDTWTPDILLFHWKWINDANMWPAVEHVFGDSAKYMKMQKELILKPKPYYYVEPILPGASGGLIVGT